ncbi:MAG: hypothetical protein NkDv07_0302 [Candidatus Improbicoccus devescovinae]|nr:MAG: hypothetical protein NkDv07_0302 [Candidatus Improbicoccus devescovinae]
MGIKKIGQKILGILFLSTMILSPAVSRRASAALSIGDKTVICCSSVYLSSFGLKTREGDFSAILEDTSKREKRGDARVAPSFRTAVNQFDLNVDELWRTRYPTGSEHEGDWVPIILIRYINGIISYFCVGKRASQPERPIKDMIASVLDCITPQNPKEFPITGFMLVTDKRNESSFINWDLSSCLNPEQKAAVALTQVKRRWAKPHREYIESIWQNGSTPNSFKLGCIK